VRWLGGSPVLVFNLLLIAGLALTAFSAWFVATRWTGSTRAGLVAGALAAFNVHLLLRLPHLQAAHAWGLPLVWYFADAVARRPAVKTGLALAVTIALVAATSVYWLIFAALILVVVALTQPLRGGAAIAVASAAGLLLAAPVLLPYLEFAREGAARPIEMVADFSARPAAYLVSLSRLYAPWHAGARVTETSALFPGAVAIALGLAGLRAVGFVDSAARRRIIAAVLLTTAAVVLSFGPATGVYRWLYDWALPMRGIRTAARFGYLALLGLAILAAYGWAWIERRLPSPRRRAIAVGCVLAAATIEAWHGPVAVEPFRGVPASYALLNDEPVPTLLVEVPFYPADAIDRNGEYVLNATSHWRPLANGYSGYTPASYRRRADSLWYFPEPRAFDTLHREGATHLMVHLEQFGADERPAVERAMAGRSDLRLLAADRDGHRLYRVLQPRQ